MHTNYPAFTLHEISKRFCKSIYFGDAGFPGSASVDFFTARSESLKAIFVDTAKYISGVGAEVFRGGDNYYSRRDLEFLFRHELRSPTSDDELQAMLNTAVHKNTGKNAYILEPLRDRSGEFLIHYALIKEKDFERLLPLAPDIARQVESLQRKDPMLKIIY